MTQKNMYSAAAGTWSPFKGCEFECLYCKPSFQLQAKRQGNKCRGCYEYSPHEHPARLEAPLPKTKAGQFIFTCSSADIHFCSTPYLKKILARIEREQDKTFLLQSKDPQTFERVEFPDNVILGTTLETNRDDLYRQTGMSKAPPPSQRFNDFLKIKHKRKQVTIEPVMEFDLKTMVGWVRRLKPVMVWIGYNSKKTPHLPEPELSKVEELGKAIENLGLGIKVTFKTMREARPPQVEVSHKQNQLKEAKGTMTKSNARAARLTKEQKQQLIESFAKTDNKAKSAADVGVNYNQAYAFLTKHGGEKTIAATKTPKAAKTADKAETAAQLLAQVKQAEIALGQLKQRLEAKIEEEQDALNEIKGEAGIK